MKKIKKVKKVNESHLKKAYEERALKEGIQREKDFEAKDLKIKELKARQTELDELYAKLKAEGIFSIGDLENKQAKAQKDVEDEVKRII